MGSSPIPPEPPKNKEVNIYMKFILNNSEGEAPPIPDYNQNSDQNNIDIIIKGEANQNKIICKNENQNVNFEIIDNTFNKYNSSIISPKQNKDNNIDRNGNKESILSQKNEENNIANTFGKNIDNNEEQKNNLNQKINTLKDNENEYNPFYGKNNLKINNVKKYTNRPNNDNNIDRNNNNQIDNNENNITNKPNNDNNIDRYNYNQMDNNEDNNPNKPNYENNMDRYNDNQMNIYEKNNDNFDTSETHRNNDNNIEHNNDEDKLSISQSVLWGSFRDLNIENKNGKQFLSDIITKKIEEGYFPLFAKIGMQKPFFYYIKQERTLKSLLTAHLLNSGITCSGEQYNLYNKGNKLDPDCPINEMNDLKLFSVIEIKK